MGQDYPARWDSFSIPHWCSEESGDGPDPLRDGSAKAWQQVVGIARRELADKVPAQQRGALILKA